MTPLRRDRGTIDGTPGTAPPPAETAHGDAALGRLTLGIDGATITITGTGFWSNACVDAHFDELHRLLAPARRHHPRFKVLVDLRASPVQARAVSQRIEREMRALWTSADRVALVVRAGLARMQMTRIMDGETHRIFDRIDLARRWLDRD